MYVIYVLPIIFLLVAHNNLQKDFAFEKKIFKKMKLNSLNPLKTHLIQNCLTCQKNQKWGAQNCY